MPCERRTQAPGDSFIHQRTRPPEGARRHLRPASGTESFEGTFSRCHDSSGSGAEKASVAGVIPLHGPTFLQLFTHRIFDGPITKETIRNDGPNDRTANVLRSAPQTTVRSDHDKERQVT